MAQRQPSPVAPPWSSHATHPVKRRVIFVKWSLQARYVAVVFVSLLMAGIIVAWDLYYTLGRLVLNEAMAPAALYPLFQQVHKFIVMKFAIYIVIAVVIAFFISHKFAGPVYRFEKVIKEIGQGNLTVRARLRRGDELIQTAESLNHMIIALQERILKDRRLAEQFSDTLTGLSRSLQSGQLTPAQAAPILQTLAQDVSSLTNEFTV